MPIYLLVNVADNSKKVVINYPGGKTEALGYAFEHKIGGEGAVMNIFEERHFGKEPMILCESSGGEPQNEESGEEFINPDEATLSDEDEL